MCSLCQSTLKEKERRELHSDSTEHVLPTLLEFSGTLQSSIDLSNFCSVSLSTVREKY